MRRNLILMFSRAECAVIAQVVFVQVAVIAQIAHMLVFSKSFFFKMKGLKKLKSKWEEVLVQSN